MNSLLALLMIWWMLSLIGIVSSPVPIIKRLVQRLIRFAGKKLWHHAYGKQQKRRGHGFALQHLVLIWNVFATIVILYALANPIRSTIDVQQAIPGLIIFWVLFLFCKWGYSQWQKLISPKKKLPGRRR